MNIIELANNQEYPHDLAHYGLALLCIDENKLESACQYEDPTGGGRHDQSAGNLFPHIYGPINISAVMSGLTALPLPCTGLILHGYSEGAISGDKHSWLMAHAVLGFLFVVFAAWHAILNRRALLNYIKSGLTGSLQGK